MSKRVVKYLKDHWFIFLSGTVLLLIICIEFFRKDDEKINKPTSSELKKPEIKKPLIPDINELSDSPEDSLIRYGKELITNTSKYLGPHGSVAQITNGLDCENCHLESGTKLYTNNFLGVLSTYPKFRERSGILESVEFRVNECMQRSLNGSSIDSLSKEMRAMVAYINWTGKNITPGLEGIKTEDVAFLPVAADPAKGAIIYQAKCKICHGDNGAGLILKDSFNYLYPPLWGENSYAVSAGMYRIIRLVSFIKYNMPPGATFKTPLLIDEDAWHVAAYINSQPHPNKKFASDWPKLNTKPVDYPFGPYTDTFSEIHHKYGPYDQIKKVKDLSVKK